MTTNMFFVSLIMTSVPIIQTEPPQNKQEQNTTNSTAFYTNILIVSYVVR